MQHKEIHRRHMTDFGEIKHLELRKIWPNEAYNFTPWLIENIDSLGKTLGIELEFTESEASVGDFSLDILGKDLGTGHPVVVENQFGNTDHDHLGKLLTYASGFDAGVVVWVAERLREEHREALEWLNQRTNSETQFFGVVVEVLQIDDSRPAFNFKPVVFPNEWKKTQKKRTEKALSPRAQAYKEFFQSLIDTLREDYRFTGARIGQPQNWYSFTSGFSGVSYGASFALGNRVRVELYIDRGDAEMNRQFFSYFHEQIKVVEHEFGGVLQWEPLEDKRACRIAVYTSGSIEDKAVSLNEIQIWMVDKLLKFKKVFEPRLQDYEVSAEIFSNGT